MKLKITVISDTHSKHGLVKLTGGDILIHAGDLTNIGEYEDVYFFLKWLDRQNYKHIIFIAGNHDFYFEDKTIAEIQKGISTVCKSKIKYHYLNDTGVTIKKLTFWGSPVQPEFYDWAFNRKRGTDINKHWKLIPKLTDVLITHGPPFEILDKTAGGQHVGCADLLKKINTIKPKLHVFGHIHEGYGYRENDHTLFINASVLNERYEATNIPINIVMDTITKKIEFVA
jgi:Icc-related predicted phosphoesterase